MEFFKPGIRIDFMSMAKPFLIASATLVIASWALVATKGLNFGIDFAGGTEALLAFKSPTELGSLKEKVAALGLEDPELVVFGHDDTGRYFVRSRTQKLLTEAETAKVKAAVTSKVEAPTLWDASDESGEIIRVQFKAAKTQAQFSAMLKEAGFPTGKVTPQTEALNPVYLIRLPGVRERLVTGLKVEYKDSFSGIDRLESVGSAVGRQMRNQGILAVLYALLGILLYLSFRFDLRYSPGAVLALVHDVSITIGIYSLLGLEFNLPIIAALLAIVGYSLNDTIVVYDRIRESEQLGLGKDLTDNINISVSDCLSRTVLTSVTTFLAVAAIYWLGGGIIQNFAFAMLVGVVIGTYSSIYIASPAVQFMASRLAERAAAQAAAEAIVSRT